MASPYRLKVFILHATFIEIRKQHIEKLMAVLSDSSLFSIDYEYIDLFEASTMNPDDIKSKVNLSKTNSGEFYDSIVRNMHINQISNAMKHGHALQLAKAATKPYDFFMFLEDDVLYGDDVITKLKVTCDTLAKSNDVDLLFLGFPSLTPIENTETTILRPTSDFYKLFPCCDSYIVASSNIQKIADAFFPIRYITNFHLSFVCSTADIKSAMAVPNIFLDGSKYGAYLSSIDPNNKLMFNPEFIQLGNMLREYKPEDDKAIALAFENMKFKNHPDVMHLNAIYLMTKGEYKKAQSILENVYDITTQNGCIVNNETDFLKTYMRLYRFIQD